LTANAKKSFNRIKTIGNGNLKRLLTPKQVAQAIGVSESSLKRWCDRGLIKTVRTVGGHRRMPIAAVVNFLRSENRDLVRPELLGLPSNTGRGNLGLDRAAERLFDALVAGDEAVCRQIVVDLYLAGQTTAAICDRALSPPFHWIGDRWECGDVAVFRERRACQIALRVIEQLRLFLPEAVATAPVAVGGTYQCDPYSLSTSMAELVLTEVGYKATSLGWGLPFPTLIDAIAELRPNVFWLSVSEIVDRDEFLDGYRKLYDAAVRHHAAVAVGGRALDESVRRKMQYAAYCDDFEHLASFVASLHAGDR
jgi:excisionase family DNA binding protein